VQQGQYRSGPGGSFSLFFLGKPRATNFKNTLDLKPQNKTNQSVDTMYLQEF
jgi:hypothetical protein